jgi:hypothetical protein
MVKAGNRMWNEMTKPNWMRESMSGEESSASTVISSTRGGASGAPLCADRDAGRKKQPCLA